MKVFTLKNLTEKTGENSVLPWEFKFVSESISEEIRKNKIKRQEWYQNPATHHCFYSGIIGAAPTLRVNKENPANEIWFLAADYDTPMSDERIREVIGQMRIKPTYVETSIGGNRRLVWVFEIPVIVSSNEFAAFFLQEAEGWLRLNLLPMLDQPAFLSTSRLLACGDKWEATGHGPVAAKEVQAFFCECGKKYRFKSTDEVIIPLDIVEAELRRLYPDTFSKWPGEFVVGSQGPSFWVKDSISSNSAIVKPEGMFTFAGHAEKAFYTWGELLGKEFVRGFKVSSIARATENIWYDGMKYHRKNDGYYVSMRKEEFVNYLRVDCNMSSKPDSSGTSAVDQALAHIHSMQRVAGAAPHVPLPPGIITFQNRRCLNTYECRAMEPAAGSVKWGPHGEFPWLSLFVDTIFYPVAQRPYFDGWLHHYYEGIYNRICRPGQAIILQGEQGCGKSFFSRSVIGPMMGGFCDASAFLLGGNSFNSELFNYPHWSLDDDAPSASNYATGGAHTMIKKIVANEVFMHNKKYEIPCPVQFGGRAMASINFDEVSGRMLPPPDAAMLDKISLFRCATAAEKAGTGFEFPERDELMKTLTGELPSFARYYLDLKVPDDVPRDTRYGFKSFQEESMIDKAKQSGSAAPFKEILLETLFEHFRQNPEAKTWVGASNTVIHLLENDPRNGITLRSYKPEKISQNLETLSREKFLGCRASTQPQTGIRLWTFDRPPNI